MRLRRSTKTNVTQNLKKYWTPTWTAVFLLALSSCAYDSEYKPVKVTNLYKEAYSGFLFPVVDYDTVIEPRLNKLVSNGETNFKASQLDAAKSNFVDAQDYIVQQAGAESTYLLPVLDWLIRINFQQKDRETADALQHHYRRIVERHYPDNPDSIKYLDYRMGCWHFILGDWYGAMFDFEDVIKRIEQDRNPSPRDYMLLKNSHDFADASAQNYAPGP